MRHYPNIDLAKRQNQAESKISAPRCQNSPIRWVQTDTQLDVVTSNNAYLIKSPSSDMCVGLPNLNADRARDGNLLHRTHSVKTARSREPLKTANLSLGKS